MAPKTHTTYRELDVVPIPQDIPELGIEAGRRGTVDTVYTDGRGSRGLYVEVSREDGTTVGFVDLEVGEDGSLSLVAYTPFSSR